MLAYQPVWQAGFIWDDDHHVTRPELRSFEGLFRIWTHLGATQQFYPIVHSAFWLEHKLWGDATAPYHWVNILLHAFSALLVAKILRRLEIPGAWLAAALFALHPVEVESVAWVSELKNTLSGFFYLSAALAYLKYRESERKSGYALSLSFFVLALLSKTVVATLPAALLVVFWWQGGRLTWEGDVRPLIPFFVAGIGAGLLTAWMERKFIGAEGAEFHLSLIERCLIAGRALWFYLGKICWPVDLVSIYARWNISASAWWQYIFPAAALALGCLLLWRKWRGALAGLLFFAGTLFPALGFFNVYPFRFSFVADHFQYLASLGPLVLAAAGLSKAGGFIRNKTALAEPALCAALLLFLGALTWEQCELYADPAALWQATLRRNPESWLAWNNLGVVLGQTGQTDEAINKFREAIRIKPDYAEAVNNLGFALARQGQMDGAIAQFREAIRLIPDYARAHYNLGLALSRKGELDEAVREYREAIRLVPDFSEARHNLGLALDRKGQIDEAIQQYREAIRLAPDFAEAYNNLGTDLGAKGHIDEAIDELREAVRLNPDYAAAHGNLGTALGAKGQIDQAIEQYREAIRLSPGVADFHDNLGAALAGKGQLDEAIREFREALRLNPASAEARKDLEEGLKAKSGNTK